MTDLSKTIATKTDQLNAEDLGLSGPITVKIIKVTGSSGDQPISIHYQGDDGKPYKPCKSMRRLLVAIWGADGSAYVGRSLTLFSDPKVEFGGIAVGGIRISHMSHMDSESASVPLINKRGSKKLFQVRRLAAQEPKPTEPEPPPKERGNIESALKTIANWAGDLKELRAGLNKYEWTKEERAQIKDSLEGKNA